MLPEVERDDDGAHHRVGAVLDHRHQAARGAGACKRQRAEQPSHAADDAAEHQQRQPGGPERLPPRLRPALKADLPDVRQGRQRRRQGVHEDRDRRT